MERLLSAQQAADRLGVSIWTVSRLARSGRLASVQIGRRRLFTEEDLETLVMAKRVGTGIQTKDELAENEGAVRKPRAKGTGPETSPPESAENGSHC